MPIQALHDLSNLTVDELYAVYQAIARADHHLRTEALYGKADPPPGHFEHRPLPRVDFSERFRLAERIVGGEAMFRSRLARQAVAYQIDVPTLVERLRAAA